MNVFLNFYQHLPEGIISMAFHIGSFAVGWYSLMYMLAFLTVYLLLRWRIKKGEGNYKLELIDEFIFYSFLGVLIGGRLGYVIFYNLPYLCYYYPLFKFIPFGIILSQRFLKKQDK